MLKPRYTRKTFYIDIPDEQAIAAIMERYGLSTHSDCVRFALRRVAEAPPAPLPGAKKRRGETGC